MLEPFLPKLFQNTKILAIGNVKFIKTSFSLFAIYSNEIIQSICRGRSVSSEQENSENEQTEKSPLVSAKLETFAKMLFNRANPSQDSTGSAPKESSSSPTRWF